MEVRDRERDEEVRGNCANALGNMKGKVLNVQETNTSSRRMDEVRVSGSRL